MLKHCQKLVATKDFKFRPHGSKKPLTIRTGQKFWVTSSQTMQRDHGLVWIARITQPMHYFYPWDEKILMTLFELEGK